MKYTTITTLAALLLGTAGTFAQTTAHTKPAGFVTHTLKAGQFNLIGLTLHKSIIASGAFDTVSGTTLTDNDLNFGTTLTAGKTYILEIIDAADTSLNGTIQEVTAWSGNTITTPQDLDVDGLAAGDKYQMRAACTIADVFGSANEAGLTEGTNIGVADVVWIPNGSGFDTFYYSPGGGFGGGTSGWKDSGGGDAADKVITYTDAIFVQSRAASDKNLVITGAVKTDKVSLALVGGFNFVSSTFPVGSTLGNSSLEDSLQQGTNIGTADVIWMPKASGGYDTFYYSPGGGFGGGASGWKAVNGSDASGVTLTSGFLIQRRSAATNANLEPPVGYSGL